MTWICECCGTEIAYKPRQDKLVCPTCGFEMPVDSVRVARKGERSHPNHVSSQRSLSAVLRRILNGFSGETLSSTLVAIKCFCILAVVAALVLFVVGLYRSGSTPVLFAAALRDNVRYYSENAAVSEAGSNLKSYHAQREAIEGTAVPENLASLFAGSRAVQGSMIISRGFQALDQYGSRVVLNIRSCAKGCRDCVSNCISNCSDGWHSLRSRVAGLSQEYLKR